MKPLKPFLIKNFFDATELMPIQRYLQRLKESQNMAQDSKLFNRLCAIDDPLSMKLHHTHAWEVARRVFPEELKPSYSFISLYEKEGVCPLHIDRPQCYYTIDVCINQAKPWPLYVNSQEKFLSYPIYLERQYETALVDEVKATSTEFLMNPGDAICYSGTHHPHWRNPIDADNFCDLIFFHFVKSSFDGVLRPEN